MFKLTGGRRVAAAAGFAPFALGGVGAAIYPSPEPSFADAPGTIAAFYTEHADAVLATRGVFLVTCVALVFFVGALRSVLAEVEGDDGWLAATAFGGGLIGVAMLVVSNAVEAGAVLRVGEQGTIDPAAASAAHDLAGVMFGLAAPTAFGVLLLATAAVAYRTRVLPRWHAVATAALGLTLALPPISYLTMTAFPFWVGVTALILVARPRTLRRTAASPAPA